MAYMNQERKKVFAAALKEALKGTGIKYTLGVHNHSTIMMNIQSSPIDFFANYYNTLKEQPRYQYQERALFPVDSMDVNVYWYQEHYTGKALEVLTKIIKILNVGNHNRSDIQCDYHDVGWYVSLTIGKWDKPYVLTEVKR